MLRAARHDFHFLSFSLAENYFTMSIRSKILVFFLCTGNAFPMLYEKVYTYDMFVKESHLYDEYVIYLERMLDPHSLDITKIDFKSPNDKQLMAALFDKLLTIELIIIFGACSVHYVLQPIKGEYADRRTYIDYIKAVGCKNAVDFLVWYSDNILQLDQFYAENEQEDKTSGRSTDASYVPVIVKYLEALQADARAFNDILRSFGHEYNSVSFFGTLRKLKPENIGENEAGPIYVRSYRSSVIRKEYHKEVFRRLVKYFGTNLELAENFFRKVIGQPPIKKTEDLIMSQEDTESFLSTVSFINWGLILKKGFGNTMAPALMQIERFKFMKPSRGVELAREQSEWEIQFSNDAKTDPEFVFIDNEND